MSAMPPQTGIEKEILDAIQKLGLQKEADVGLEILAMQKRVSVFPLPARKKNGRRAVERRSAT
ncbi:MAG: hypothetical protein A2934_02850 [Candidatus Sungbacteria bacterium RIFCSPLOWO2_01_FULL_47_10]|uniref:Uncharacterized protein n=1 Tax=Candidatus Sungbacteria bacterium RIFCSPLOWO2_01_FULL_47_10 TaxID=1802276 RepID=A0A1G2L7Z6_9BACT|nr:MAG: hypothetical protein A2934_02850 [Candidatus Sungbacteria bacterium RIFCSPLOWO2_01_FULL_47_10]